ncbi:glycoside hydrolase family 97 protein [Segetibacter sp. 3557_3]|uniref:glycoside hydrolase family 97 protein n=1 Tax=Segetibacter sp. 3557_3 TaxID=2547429 RepID=UPI001058E573|nr:glycoside hydrolase family 97 protein [Segetibacter sp. 3557_3]TDH26601.1 glycoside hydrolase family 97 protein [Segetibacter sp. 3557_3]
MQKLIAALVLLIFTSGVSAKDYRLQSPDKHTEITVSTGNKLTWSVAYDGNVLLKPGEISMVLSNAVIPAAGAKVQQEKRSSKNEMITAVVPVKSRNIRSQYNELLLTFKEDYSIRFRAYDDGAVYRFETRFREPKIKVVSETCNYNFSDNFQVFWPTETDTAFQSHFENLFKDSTIAAFNNRQHGNLPMLLTAPSGTRVLISEADLYDYPNMFLFGTSGNGVTAGFPKVIKSMRPRGDRSNTITALEDFIAETAGTRTFPWRTVSITNDDKKILENNLTYKLATPSVLTDVSWIKPGKVAWDWWNANNIYGVNFKAGLNTETYKYYIDFASKFGLEYVILDEGWSLTTTNVLQARPEIDIPELVRYGNTKNVGIILWSLWNPLDKDMDNILDQFVKWGVKGTKVDFMARADQYMVNFYERAAVATAKRKLLLDLHGAYKPVGLNRKYPNVISYEGVRGAENNKWEANITPKHNVTLPFTRMTAGPMDYTPGAMINASKENFRIVYTEPMSMGTRAHQAAMYVVYESPLQMLCDNPSNYLQDSTFTRFISGIPTTWDTTIALQAKAGQYVAVARKHGARWYIGAMTDFEKRDVTAALSFLDNRKYNMRVVADGINADNHAADYTISSQAVQRGDNITMNLMPGGGWVAVLVPEGE